MNISGLSASFNPYAANALRSGASATGRVAESAKAESGGLTPDELADVDKLKARDREVRQHEQAHLAAAGGLASSGASYTYQRGPDGVNYAVGGEVSISVSPGRTPEETLRRAQTVRAAALAPSDPSGADRAVAAAAGKMEQEALAELAAQRLERGKAGGQGDDVPGKQSAAAANSAALFKAYGESEDNSSRARINTYA